MQPLFEKWDQELWKKLQEDRQLGELSPKRNFELKIVGQIALLLADLPMEVAATRDIDILHHIPYSQMKGLEKMFLDVGLVLERDQGLIWMPDDTVYHPLFSGKLAQVYYADALDVMTSKAKYKRSKDKILLRKYFKINSGAKEKIRQLGIDINWVEGKK